MRGPNRPNFYEDLRSKSEASPEREAEGEAPATVNTLRRDNARMADDNAAFAHAATRREQDSRDDREALGNAQLQVRQADEMEKVEARFKTMRQSLADMIEEREAARTGEPVNPNDPYIRALREGADRDPYEAMRKGAMAEYAAFAKEQGRFDERIAEAETLDARHSLEQRKDIHAASHLAKTHHRIADLDELMQGTRDTEFAVEARGRASAHEDQARKVQQSYRQRTGRDAAADNKSDDDLAREAASPRSGSEPTKAEMSLAKEWGAAGGELTDRQRERLSALSDGSGESTGSDGPTRPRETSGRSY